MLELIDKYYPADAALGKIYRNHCSKVADLAIEIARSCRLPLDEDEIRNAAMLHDIGIFLCDAPGIECRGSEPYICHGYLGADLLRREGVDERLARVAERHTGTGLQPEEIAAQHLPLPSDRTYMPETLLEKLVCYADKFYSKSGEGERKTLAEVRRQMARLGEPTARRLEELVKLFTPDNKITTN